MADNLFHAEFSQPSGKKITFSGTLTKEKLHADVKVQGQKEIETGDYYFTLVSFPKIYQPAPADPAYPVRFDGIYYEKNPEGLPRFFPDKVVVSAIAADTVVCPVKNILESEM